MDKKVTFEIIQCNPIGSIYEVHLLVDDKRKFERHIFTDSSEGFFCREKPRQELQQEIIDGIRAAKDEMFDLLKLESENKYDLQIRGAMRRL